MVCYRLGLADSRHFFLSCKCFECNGLVCSASVSFANSFLRLGNVWCIVYHVHLPTFLLHVCSHKRQISELLFPFCAGKLFKSTKLGLDSLS